MKISSRILTIFLTFLALGFGTLALTGCTADYIFWADIYVFNESDFDISVTMISRELDSSMETYEVTVYSKFGINPKESARYNGESGHYHIKINGNGNTWYYPDRYENIDTNAFERMEEEVELIFDGETITKGKGKK